MDYRHPRSSIISLEEFVAHLCVFCRRPLFPDDVTLAVYQAKRKKVPPPQAGDICCQRKDCKKARKRKLRDDDAMAPDSIPDEHPTLEAHENPQDSVRESALFEGASQIRRSEDGVVREEARRVDFEFLTSQEVEERGVRKAARTDEQIAQALLDRVTLGNRCEVHGTPDCTPCRMLKDAYQRLEAGELKVHPVEKTKTEQNQLTDLEREVLAIIRGRDSKTRTEMSEKSKTQSGGSRKYYQHGYNNRVSDRPEKSEKKTIKTEPTKKTPKLRLEHGYTVRQIAELLDDPRINAFVVERDMAALVTDPKFRKLAYQIARGTRRSFPRCHADLVNILPRKWRRIFTPGEIGLYRDYAAGNVTVDELKQRVRDGQYGRAGSVEDLLALENKIIAQAWATRLLIPAKRGVRPEDSDRDLNESHNLETGGIKTGAVAGGSVIPGRYSTAPGKTFQIQKLNSFEHGGKQTRHGSGDTDFDSSQGAVEDGYGEESDV